MPINAAEKTYDADCIHQALQTLPPQTPLADIRQNCLIKPEQSVEPSALEKRLQAERLMQNSRFTLQAYKPNYLLLGSYNFNGVNEKPFKKLLENNDTFDAVEVKFQLSVKVPVSDNLIGMGDHWFVGYTNRSFWQAYNGRISAPFRESNHEPEFWVSFDNEYEVFGWKNRLIDFGMSHQSNGQADNLSRSWNRTFLRFIFEQDTAAFGVKTWLRVPEAPSGDDNPDIGHYMGNAEFFYMNKYENHNFRVMARNNFNPLDNKGAIELGYSYPVHRNLNLYLQWFYGYGESLIDYNYLNNSLSIGVQFGNLL